MTKLHDENFYFYQNDLLDEKDFPDLENATAITRPPDTPGGPSPWSGGVGLRRGGTFLARRRDDEREVADRPEPPRRPDHPPWELPPLDVPLKVGAQSWLEAVRRWQR